ncbi:MAG: hypothetical protein J5553_00090 [Verrucomicrobia bacterium]|nr:hypothetical protein [Verrucomicrobiota bacterium]
MMKAWSGSLFKSVLAGALVFTAQGVYAQDPAKDFAYSGERIDLTSPVMNIGYLFTETHEVKDSSIQGAAVYGKYLFQFNNFRERCAIYDLETGKLVQTIELERDKLLHCNNANFSRQYYDGSDPFPLLYISMENILKHNVMVYRLTGKEGEFRMEPVQTITWPKPEDCGCYYPNVILDNENGKIIQMGYTQNNFHVAEGNKLIIRVYPLPLREKGDVTFTPADAEKSFELPCVTATQGAFCRNNRIYQIYGINLQEGLSLRVIDLDREKFVTCVNLPDIGIKGEQEGIGFYKEGIIMTGQDRRVHFLTFK